MFETTPLHAQKRARTEEQRQGMPVAAAVRLFGCLMVGLTCVMCLMLGVLTFTHVRAYTRVSEEYARLDREVLEAALAFMRDNQVRERAELAVRAPLGYLVEGADAGATTTNHSRALATQLELAQTLHRLLELVPALGHAVAQADRLASRFGGGGLLTPPPPPPPAPNP